MWRRHSVAVRADKVAGPGQITEQMIAAILDHDFRIADLTGHNPNVFYELALARAAERPVIMMKPVVSPDETSGASRIVVGARIVDGHARHWKYIKVNDRREGFQQIPLTPEIG